MTEVSQLLDTRGAVIAVRAALRAGLKRADSSRYMRTKIRELRDAAVVSVALLNCALGEEDDEAIHASQDNRDD